MNLLKLAERVEARRNRPTELSIDEALVASGKRTVSDKQEGEALGRLLPVHAWVQDYEFRSDDGDHVPTADERALIEDAIEGYLFDLEHARAAKHSQLAELVRSFVALADLYASIDDPDQRLSDTPLYVEALASLPTDNRRGGE